MATCLWLSGRFVVKCGWEVKRISDLATEEFDSTHAFPLTTERQNEVCFQFEYAFLPILMYLYLYIYIFRFYKSSIITETNMFSHSLTHSLTHPTTFLYFGMTDSNSTKNYQHEWIMGPLQQVTRGTTLVNQGSHLAHGIYFG